MQVKYGSYTHDHGEVALNVSRDTIYTAEDIPNTIREQWVLDGMLIPGIGEDVDTMFSALSTAYASDGNDLALYDDVGAETNLFLHTADCIGGTQVSQHPSLPTAQGAAYVSNLPYRIVVRGDRPIVTAESQLVSWRETITRQGGGPKFAMTETLYGRPIRQQLRRFTTYFANQSGSAVGRFRYPSPPRPIWPSALTESPPIVQIGPRRRAGGEYENFEIQWSYNYAAAVAMLGNPTVR